VIRLAVRCRPEAAERVLAELIELAPSGVEEADGDGYVELAVYGAPGEVPELPDLEAAAAGGLIAVTTAEVPDDWADRWRDFHQPTAIAAGRLVIRPSWIRSDRGAEDAAGLDVVVDPGQAFGTGAHATTRMCLELLLDVADAGGADGGLADLGTGSGVLAIAAAKLGWRPVIAVDSEIASLEAAAANARANAVEVDLRRVNLRREAAPAAATLVANLTAPLLVEVAPRLGRQPRAMICSGLLASESGRVEAALAGAGLTVAERRESGEWAALRLERRSDAARG